VHLIIERGPVKGRNVTVPLDGVRIGRSSRNDLSIDDPAISRFQCRLFFKPGEGLWLSDLGSANGTLVNGKEVQEQRLHPGDEIILGDSLLRVVSDQEGDLTAQPEAFPAPSPVQPVDLGLRKESPLSPPSPIRRRLLWLASAMVLVVCLAWLPKIADFMRSLRPAREKAPVQTALPGVDVSFERVEASSSNIFRYVLEVIDNRLNVQVDDLVRNRHVRREKKVSAELVKDLGRAIDTAGFFDLLEDYSGVAPGIYETTDITVTIGARTHHVRVLNHVDPEGFLTVRNAIEEFGKNELGLAALAIDPAELVRMAQHALLQGKKLYDEREVSYGNLFSAIRSFREAEWYLETIEPKPDFYTETLGRKADCERELQKRYDDIWFIAERAIKLRDWKEAARNLRVIIEMIPDRSDDRNGNAYKKLVDVERHLATEK
jgi:hypothetical protein